MKEIYFADIESTDFKENLQELIDNDIDCYQLEFKLGCLIQFDYNKNDVYLDDKNNVIFNNNDNIIKKDYSDNEYDFFLKLVKGCHRNKKRIIYFHNLTFDSKFFIDYLNAYFERVEPIKTNSSLLCLKCYKKRKNGNQYDCILEIKDSLSLLLVSLKKIGLMLNLPKLKFDFNYNNFNVALEYCYRDCEIPYYAMKLLFLAITKEFEIINKRTKKPILFHDLPLTIASLSKKIIMEKYPHVFYKVDKHLEKRIRKYYFGGRTELFKANKDYFLSYLDENSEYPAKMKNELFSNGITYMVSTDKIDFENNENILAYELVIKERLQFPNYPTRYNDKIFYCNGVKTIIMTRKEYFHFLNNNYFKSKKIEILEVKFAFITSETINFSEFVNKLYKLRKSFDSNHIFHYVFKILLNSGYGKLAERYIKETFEFINDDIELDESMNLVEIDNVIMKKSEFYQEYLKINLFNAVLITSYARFDIWLMLEKCSKMKISTYYTDTDSVVVKDSNLNMLKDFMSETEIGKWKIEQKFLEFQAIDSKEYYKIINQNNIPTFYSKFKGVKNDYINSKEKLISHINNGTLVNLIGSFFYCKNRHGNSRNVYIIRKHKQSYFYKRFILPNGSTIPLEMYQLNETDLKLVEKNNKKYILNELQKTSRFEFLFSYVIYKYCLNYFKYN